MTNYERILQQTLDEIRDLILKRTTFDVMMVNYGECPPEPFPCQKDVNDHCNSCLECWRIWMDAEEDG